MSAPFRKHRSVDKYDAHMPNKAHWINDNFYVGMEQERFHTSTAYGYFEGKRRPLGFGIQKRVWMASGSGIMIDSIHVGKSDNT